MEPAMPLVLAQSLPAPRLPVSLWVLSLASSPTCTSSLWTASPVSSTHPGLLTVTSEWAGRSSQLSNVINDSMIQ